MLGEDLIGRLDGVGVFIEPRVGEPFELAVEARRPALHARVMRLHPRLFLRGRVVDVRIERRGRELVKSHFAFGRGLYAGGESERGDCSDESEHRVTQR